MEFHADNPTAPNKPVAVMTVYNNTPAGLSGKKMGAPVCDAGRLALRAGQVSDASRIAEQTREHRGTILGHAWGAPSG